MEAGGIEPHFRVIGHRLTAAGTKLGLLFTCYFKGKNIKKLLPSAKIPLNLI
jgi:hypothetical protein